MLRRDFSALAQLLQPFQEALLRRGRALPSRRPGIGVVVLLNDDEVRPCPQAAHDQAVDWLVTPSRTLRATPTS